MTFSFTSENTSLAVTTPFKLPPVMIAVPPIKPSGRPGSGSFEAGERDVQLGGSAGLTGGDVDLNAHDGDRVGRDRVDLTLDHQFRIRDLGYGRRCGRDTG